MKQVCDNINPFSDDINPRELFNLSTGKAASSETSAFLLNVTSIGAKQRDNFIQECVNDSNRFNRPIKRNSVKTFAVENVKHKTSSLKKIDDAGVERNVLGHVLCYVMQNRIDLLSVLSYPLTTLPHSLANLDGTMISNSQKGELASLLMPKIDGIGNRALHANDFEVEIVDGFYYLNTLKDSPVKYGQFANFLLKRLCDSRAFEIHLMFDKYEVSSIRDVDIKKNVHQNPMQYEIKGPNQERNGALSKYLTNSNFRDELVKYLMNHWAENEECGSILFGKRVFVSYGQQCYLFSQDHGKKKIVKGLENNHIELESKMILHLQKIVAKNIVIKIASTDTLLVYLIYHMQFWSTDKENWIETGDVYRNTRQTINVGRIYGQLSHLLINALPAWYVFTGCSYEPSFYGKGRRSCFKILEKNTQFQISFGNIGSSLSISQNDAAVLEQYTCALYHTNNVSKPSMRLDRKCLKTRTEQTQQKEKISVKMVYRFSTSVFV